MKIDDIKDVSWADYSADYIIGHPRLSPIIADPTFCFPADSPDGQWHLFAHSAWGIHHFTSPDGASWKDRGICVPNGMRPYLYIEDGTYYLLYEKYTVLALALTVLPGRKWYSEIVMRRSKDLKKWSAPVTLVKPEKEWQQSATGKSVSNPCLVKVDGCYRLYFSASLVYIKDCGFNEPDSIGLALSSSLYGPYAVQDGPVIRVNKEDPWCNLSCGSVKVLKCEDGYAAFENGIYWDHEEDRSGSAIIVLSSPDGLNWSKLVSEPVLKPTNGWRSSHIYACDVKYNAAEKSWYMYYNARNGWKVNQGEERIGLLKGK